MRRKAAILSLLVLALVLGCYLAVKHQPESKQILAPVIAPTPAAIEPVASTMTAPTTLSVSAPLPSAPSKTPKVTTVTHSPLSNDTASHPQEKITALKTSSATTAIAVPVTTDTTSAAAPVAATAPLGERLLSNDENIAKNAESEIPKLSDDEKTKLAFSILNTVKSVSDPAMQSRIADKAGPVLVHLGPAAFPALIKGLSDSVAVIRMKSAYALGAFGAFAKEALNPLIHNADKDPDVFARCDAIDALGKMGPVGTPAVTVLVNGLRSDNKLIRFHAVEAVGGIGPTADRAVPGLTKILNEDPDVYTRGSAAQSLGQMGAKAASAVPSLIKALHTNDQRLQQLARTALKQIGTPEALAAAAKQK